MGFSDGGMFDPAMLASMPNPNFEYPWGEWDPAVFNNVQQQMAGLDPAQYGMTPADLASMTLSDHQHHGHGHGQRPYT